MRKAQLVIPTERIEEIHVRLTFELTLAECAELEADIKSRSDPGQHEAASYELRSLGRELQDLREQLEERVQGLKFQPSEQIDEGNTDAST